MTLLYRSTRGKADNALTASAAILQGLSPDGGLYVPTEKPQLDLNLNDLPGLTYQQVAFNVLSAFLTDFNAEELKACVNAAYDDKFDDAAIAPVSHHGKDFYLELFHGPTIAFKDLALSILPHLMTTAAKKQHFDKQIDQALNIEVLPDPKTAAKDLGLLNMANNGGQVFGPIFAASVIGLVGYHGIFPLASAMAIIGSILIIFIKKIK